MSRDESLTQLSEPQSDASQPAPGCGCFPVEAAAAARLGGATPSCACNEIQGVVRRERRLSKRDVVLTAIFVALVLTVVLALWR
jgi:hypothetical protein